MRTDFLFVEAATEKYSTKISVEKFRYALHWSCPGIVVKKNCGSAGITKKGIFYGFCVIVVYQTSFCFVMISFLWEQIFYL